MNGLVGGPLPLPPLNPALIIGKQGDSLPLCQNWLDLFIRFDGARRLATDRQTNRQTDATWRARDTTP